MSAARDIEDRAARWLIRREDVDWSALDQADLDAWLDESMAHKAAYWRLEHGWREADRIGSLGLVAENESRQTSWLTGWWKPTALAASLAAVIAVGTIQLEPSAQRPEIAEVRFDTPVGGRKTIPLSDGSRVELNTATLVRTAVNEDRREVWLERGEAYFQIAKAEGRPFIVHAGTRTVTVLGTKFSVRRDGDNVTVAVAEGRVRIEDSARQQAKRSATISAGDVAITRGSSTMLTARSTERVESALAWRDGMLSFDQSTLAEAAAEFNRYNRRPIVIDDPEVAAIRIGGTFQASNVEAFARLLRDAYGLRVETSEGAVTISS